MTKQCRLQSPSGRVYKVTKSHRARDSEHQAQNAMEVSDTETIDHDFKDLEEPCAAREEVFETTELMEHIISFLPMKKIFNVQRVSKRWNDVIAASPGIQEKMFLRLKTTPKDMYEARKLGRVDAGQSKPGSGMIADMVTVVAPNPELRYDEFCRMRRFGVTCLTHGNSVVLRWGPAPIRECLSLLDTYISDPPCKVAEVCLTVRFKIPADEFGCPQSKPEYPIKIWVDGVIASSESGLTFQDVLRAALYARRQTKCKDDFRFPSPYFGKKGAPQYKTFSWNSSDQLRDVIGLLPKYTGIHEILDCPMMELKLTLLDDVAAPTPEEWAVLRKEISPR